VSDDQAKRLDRLEALIELMVERLGVTVIERTIPPDTKRISIGNMTVNVVVNSLEAIAVIKSGDSFTTEGDNLGAQGRLIKDNTFTATKIVQQEADPKALAAALKTLLDALRPQADLTNSDHLMGLGKVAEAEKEAAAGNTSKALAALKSAGSWVLDFVKATGSSLLKDLIKDELGL
jgi:hypothetical protein